MNLEDNNLSFQFYNYLCDIVGSEEVIRTRREIFTAKDIQFGESNTSILTSISSGSKAEGLDLEGSDYDEMFLHNFVRVYESSNNVLSDPDKIALIMDTNDTKPGFTKLKLVNKSSLDVIPEWCETVGEETYISSKCFREDQLCDDMVIHGPCQSTANGDYDYASCLRCLIHSELKRIRTGYTHICRRDICVYIICDSARKSIHDMLNLTDRNKSFYKQYKRLFAYLKIILQSDSVSSWLLLASLFYNCKQYKECLVMTNYYLSRCTPDMIYLHLNNSLAEQTVFEQMKQRLGLLLAFKHLIIEDALFQYPFYLLPDELIPLVVKEHLSIPPVVYSYLLQFLCCHYLGDKRGKHTTLHDLGLTIKERYFMWEDYITLKTLTQICEIVKALL
ncbi:unnamed protein product [Mytilus edulis]|uniref:Mab-21-like HhH/H2TH-like domain-containing protein n=1 Tax=Mytilus edulis TaxID=6550 RepID=A0A8S3Q7D6_MYTED|nr:unnamed protein product [Mytilus edulis]